MSQTSQQRGVPMLSAPDALMTWPTRQENEWATTLVVDPSDPFFFDHPLDHVPGILLVLGILDLVRAVDGRTVADAGQRVSMSVDFPSFGELDQATTLKAIPVTSPGQATRWAVRAEQAARPVLNGWVELGEDRAPTRPGRSPAVDESPVLAELVHRNRPENILVGEPIDDGGEVRVPLISLPTTHVLSRRGGGGRGVEELIEAARQFATYIFHMVDNVPLGTQMILFKLDVDLPGVLPRDWPLSLRTSPGGRQKRRSKFRIDLVGDDPKCPRYGRCDVGGMAVGPAIYRRLRHSGRSA